MRSVGLPRFLLAVILCKLCASQKYNLRRTLTFELKGPVKVFHVSGKTIAEVVTSTNGTILLCRLHEVEEEQDAEDIVKKLELPVKYPSFTGMMNLIRECNKFPLISSNTDPQVIDNPTLSPEGWNSFWKGILPGTKWCGMGDVATSFDDLGIQSNVDKCCRAHDLCPIKLKSFRTGYGLINYSFYTKSHCDCDNDLYNCLKETKNEIADAVGNVYFNILQVQCLKHRQSFICVRNRTDSDGENCVQWEIDPNTNMMQNSIPLARY